MADERSADAIAATKGSLGIFLMQTVGRLAGLTFAVAAGRTLAPSSFGRYASAVALAALFAVVADLGTTSAISRLVSRGQRTADEVLSATVMVNVVLGIAGAAATTAAAALLYEGPVVVDAAIAGAALPLTAVSTSIFGALDGRGRIAQRAALGVVTPVVQYLIGAVVLLATEDVRIAIAMVPLGAAATLTSACLMARRSTTWTLSVRTDRAIVREVLRTAVPFAALAGISTMAARFDLVLLGTLAGTDQTGVYDVAVRTMEASSYLAATVSGPVLFLMNRRLAEGNVPAAQRVLHRAAPLTYFVGFGVSAVTLGAAEEVVLLLFGDEYIEAVVPLQILGAHVWIVFAVAVLGAVLMASERVVAIVPLAASVTAATVFMDLLLVPGFGANGAAAAALGSSALAFFAFRRATVRRLGLAYPGPPPVLVMGWAAAVAAAALAPDDPILLAPATAAIVFLAGAWIGGVARPRELMSLVRPPRADLDESGC